MAQGMETVPRARAKLRIENGGVPLQGTDCMASQTMKISVCPCRRAAAMCHVHLNLVADNHGYGE
jgi:hypothetical protein